MDSRLNFQDWYNLVGKGTYGSEAEARAVFDSLFGAGGVFASGISLPGSNVFNNNTNANGGTPINGGFNPGNLDASFPIIDFGLGSGVGSSDGDIGNSNTITLGTGAGGPGGVFPFFSDPNSIVGNIIGPSLGEIQGALKQDGVIPSDDGAFNRPLLDDIIAAIPPVTINPTGTPPSETPPSGTPQQQNKPEPPPKNRGGPNPNLPGAGGSGQIPSAPSGLPTGGTSDDPFDKLNDIFRSIFFPGAGGGVRTPPFNPNGGGDVSDINDLLNLPIFGGGGQGGTASATGGSNFLSDLIGDIVNDFNLSDLLTNVGNTAIDFGMSDYVADKQLEANKDALDLQRYIYDSNINRLEPFRQSGLSSLPALSDAAGASPAMRDLFSGRQNINPRTNVTIDGEALPMVDASLSYNTPTANSVSVNEFNPYDANDPRLQYLIDQGTRAIEGSAAARGKLNSGGTLEALQEMGQNAALGRANEIQALDSDRDRLALASDNQRFGQELGAGSFDLSAQTSQFGQDAALRNLLFGENVTGANFDLAQDQSNIANMLNLDDLRFNQNFDANTDALRFDRNRFGKLYENARLSQNSAAQQGADGANFAAMGSNILQNDGDIRTVRTKGFENALSRLF